jgi:DnaJ-class molecular chaperone
MEVLKDPKKREIYDQVRRMAQGRALRPRSHTGQPRDTRAFWHICCGVRGRYASANSPPSRRAGSLSGPPQYGEEALKEGMGGGGPGGGMEDLLAQMFGGGGGRGRQQRERKSDDVVHKIQVPLEDLYTGSTK